VRDLLARFLGKEGFRVETAASGEEGLRLAHSLRPEVITLDVMMPGMDGWAVLEALKADPATTSIPVVMLTIVDNKNQGYALGVADYLTKPVEREHLLAVLRYYCSTDDRPVLIVEDDEATREMMRRTLEKDGWACLEAENGLVGLDRVAARIPSLILLDLMMPEMDGFEFAETLRANPIWRDIPIVVVTAKALTPEDRTRLTGSVVRILEKGGYTREALLQEIRHLVGSRQGRARSRLAPGESGPA
jgi:CheY-like chemotaxis protein